MNTEISRQRVMIVDDTPANLGLLEDLLVANDIDVAAFPKGSMALVAAAKQPPDLILLDIMMPEMDGYEVCKFLKADPLKRNIPVIFISAYSKIISDNFVHNITYAAPLHDIGKMGWNGLSISTCRRVHSS